nr:insulinase family protein [Bacilli bacterium]
MQELFYEQINETLFKKQLDNGLMVYIMPKKDFRQTYACFTTRYGSIDRSFVVPGTDTPIEVPDGIAHFLEHKMFEEEEGDVFTSFARYGAQANAFTTFDATTYLFSCTDHVNENLETLLNFVQHPYFTDDNVNKEKGIIAQEIRMYDDNPNTRVYYGLLEAMFGKHPAGINIAGTVESIAEITKENLYACYDTFYHPSNMILFVVGDVVPHGIMAQIEANQTAKNYRRQATIERTMPPLPAQVHATKVSAKLAIAQPRVLFGYREDTSDLTSIDRQKHEQAMGIWMDCVLGKGSALYQAWLAKGLIDHSFGMNYISNAWCGYSIFGGNTTDPDQLVQHAKEALPKALAVGIDHEDFLLTKKKAIGQFLQLLDSPQAIANVYTLERVRGFDLFDQLTILQSLTIDDVHQAMRTHLHEHQFCVSEVLPIS